MICIALHLGHDSHKLLGLATSFARPTSNLIFLAPRSKVGLRGFPVQVSISARHGHLSPEHQAVIQEKTEKLLHFFDRLNFIEVTVDLKNDLKSVEILAKAEHKHEFIGLGESPDLMVALHAALDKAKHQIHHYKERLQDHRRDPRTNGGGLL
jgi:putative sigma-54 modulation protein